MMHPCFKLHFASALTAFALGGATLSQAQDLEPRQFTVVGTVSVLSGWKKGEVPFWNEMLPAASNGKLTANLRSVSELGLAGTEVMRQLQAGVWDFAHGVSGYIISDTPAVEAPELPGMATDFAHFRELEQAFRPYMQELFEKEYNAKLLAIWPWVGSTVLCKLPDKSSEAIHLSDLKGKKVRSHATALGDFVEAFGATSVTMPFGDVLPALERGVIDCTMTGPDTAYNGEFHQVVTHILPLYLGDSTGFLAVNLDVWNGLDDQSQEVILREAAKFEEIGFAAAAVDGKIGLDCIGEGPCDSGSPGGVKIVLPNEADEAAKKKAFIEAVLPSFAKRCGRECVERWNAAVGSKLGGVTATID